MTCFYLSIMFVGLNIIRMFVGLNIMFVGLNTHSWKEIQGRGSLGPVEL